MTLTKIASLDSCKRLAAKLSDRGTRTLVVVEEGTSANTVSVSGTESKAEV